MALLVGGSGVFRKFGVRPFVLMCRGSPEFAYSSVPKPAPANDLLQADALIWAPLDAISIVHVPFVERLPLGPQNAFIDA